jgi:molybdopterin-guanine dinucleotide biosynthesis protein A
MATAGLTGILLVGGASSRFGSPKALALFGGVTLAERAWRTLAAACDECIAVGKAAELSLPFAVLDDENDIRAPLAGIVAGLRAARNELAVFLPVDTPRVAPGDLRALASECVDAAVPQTGPLPCALHRRALPHLEQKLATNELTLRDAFSELATSIVELEPRRLVNVNTPADLQALVAS